RLVSRCQPAGLSGIGAQGAAHIGKAGGCHSAAPVRLRRTVGACGMTTTLQGLEWSVLQSLPQPILVCGEGNRIFLANYSAEAFFGASSSVLTRQTLDDLI